MTTNLQDAINSARLSHNNEIRIYHECEAALEEACRRSAGADEFELLQRRKQEQNRVVFGSYARLLDAMAEEAEESEKRMGSKHPNPAANVE